ANIAAASILAKTYRDDFMTGIAAQYPAYSWDVNKGYPTAAHRAAIAAEGPSPYHRLTFRLLDQQPTLF
ncbi:MAG: ribonuclease HII, partial [Candidatus Amulumruptor sp.]|nr:ribonuclease HII [Candidatus Amulumruptor sp.]